MPEAWNWLSWAQLTAGDPEAAVASSVQVQRLYSVSRPAVDARRNAVLRAVGLE